LRPDALKALPESQRTLRPLPWTRYSTQRTRRRSRGRSTKTGPVDPRRPSRTRSSFDLSMQMTTLAAPLGTHDGHLHPEEP